MTAEGGTELRIPDVLTFLAVCRHGSVTGAARDLRVTPSQVSKAVARLEKHLKRSLLSRKARGVTASEEGQKIVPRLEELVEKVQSLAEVSEVPPEMKLTLAAPSYLCAAFLPTVVSAVPDARFRGLECGNAFMRAYATENVFQVAITIGEEKLPESWVSTRAGSMRRGLFASPELARRIGNTPSLAKIRATPFILPVYSTGGGGQFLPGDDGCPIPREERVMGHEAATVGVALELAAATNQLAFGPVIAARTLVLAGRLVEIRVPNWRLTESLYFHANADRVLARVQKAVVEALRETAREA
jgi:DNA-binding transcriptional LysR family regulator